jgi:hypothetical protein
LAFLAGSSGRRLICDLSDEDDDESLFFFSRWWFWMNDSQLEQHLFEPEPFEDATKSTRKKEFFHETKNKNGCTNTRT